MSTGGAQFRGFITPSLRARTALAPFAAVVMALLVAGQSAAASWGTPVALSMSSHSFAEDLVALGGDNAVVLYTDGGDVIVKRTTNGGGSWSSGVTLSGNGIFPHMAGRGSKVDVVWPQNGRARYTRSTNGGVSFAPSVRLSPRSDDVQEEVEVARGSNGRVAVVWNDITNPDPFGTPHNRLRIRLSHDGGQTFGPARTLATGRVQLPSVAFGRGAIYFAYRSSPSQLYFRRSLNFGDTWSAPALLSNNLFDHPLLTAARDEVYVSYSSWASGNSWARYKRSTNRGATFGSAVNLSSKNGEQSFVAEMTLRGGLVQAAFERCVNNCNRTHVFYRQSTDGVNWTPAEKVSTNIGVSNWPAGVAFADRILVAYSLTPADGGFYGYVRAGTP